MAVWDLRRRPHQAGAEGRIHRGLRPRTAACKHARQHYGPAPVLDDQRLQREGVRGTACGRAEGLATARAGVQLDTVSPMRKAPGIALRFGLFAIFFGSMAAPNRALTYTGIVVDAVTEKPLEGAMVTFGDRVA